MRFSSFDELLWRRIRNGAGGDLAYIVLPDGEKTEIRITYSELDCRARSIAAVLNDRVSVGDRVVLLYPFGLDFVIAFLGCLYAGVVAVPAYPPRADPGRWSMIRLEALVHDCSPALALTNSRIAGSKESLNPEFRDLMALEWLATEWVADCPEQKNEATAHIEANTLAMLQYTSGSTGSPKGVMITHGNLMANQAVLAEGMEQNERSVAVIWLPPYHDMGLFGGIIHPLYLGFPCVLMSAVHFLQRPSRWLRAVSKYRGTISGGPNFAYDLCVQRIKAEQCDGLDLSSWEVAFNGAEPIRADTLDRFSEKFEPYGFRKAAFYPCFGLAEATLMATGCHRRFGPVTATIDSANLREGRAAVSPSGKGKPIRLVSSGGPFAGHRIEIVSASGDECRDGVVGEIWIEGPSVAAGYWQKLEETRETFAALVNGSEIGRFLRTGDLGFRLKEEIFVTGRIKDLIVIDGRNLYPQEIEATVSRCVNDLAHGATAAFGVDFDGKERLVIVHEVTTQSVARLREIVQRILHSVSQEHGVRTDGVALVRPHTIPKTTSGKIRRRECKRAFVEDTLQLVARWPESSRRGDEEPDREEF
jgi:acyl-CoA synthetase (AMP-forming)/AMP-acid ligase II